MESAPRRCIVRVADREVAAAVEADGQVRVDGHESPFAVEPAGDGVYIVRDRQRAWVVHVAGPPDARQVFVEGQAAIVEVAAAGERKARRRGHDHGAFAPMPATVIDIVVSAGQAVAAGDVLLTLEAMKMEMPVRAPRGGTVASVSCAIGELVQPGVLLVDIV
jgi:biotin carboxyl carrier protein